MVMRQPRKPRSIKINMSRDVRPYTYRPLGVEEDLGRYDEPDPTLTPAEADALTALPLPHAPQADRPSHASNRRVLRCSLKKFAADGASEDWRSRAGRGIRCWA